MSSKRRKLEFDLRGIRAWFDLAPGERAALALVLAIALIGLVARQVHLSRETPEPYQPAGVDQIHAGGAP